MRKFSLSNVVTASIRHGWKISLAVSLGIATATAVIVGALLVGDSMRGSLRELTTQRLGKTVSVLAPGSFFDPAGVVPSQIKSYPLLMFTTAVAEYTDGDVTRRAGSLQIIGCDDSFWELDTSDIAPAKRPDDQSVVLNQSAADELGVGLGDEITIRLPAEQAVPADSTLGKRDIRTEGIPRMKVVEIVPDRGLGRFSMAANQASPGNIFVSREVIGEVLDREGQANVVLFDQDVADDQLIVDQGDLGLNLQQVTLRYPADDTSDSSIIYDYYSLTSDRLLIQQPAVDAIVGKLPADSVSELSTYLANAIERIGEDDEVLSSIPYSIVTAVDGGDSLPLDYTINPNWPTELKKRIPVVLNQWAAEKLDASVGTPLRFAYYEPEVEDGAEVERYFDTVVTAVVPITKPAKPYGRRNRPPKYDQSPTVYNDPHLTPEVPGVTDKATIDDWDLPFPLERKTNKDDDEYWEDYRLTPKAFVPLAIGKKYFGSRFGETTGLRISKQVGEIGDLTSKINEAVEPELSALGWAIQPIRKRQLSAAKGTTPFDGLFLALSFFVIFAAVMLISMLFRLGLVQRSRQFGTLMATGWSPKRVSKLALSEGMLVSLAGVVLGVVAGIGYAKLILYGLRTWWVGAVTVPFLRYHATPLSLSLGAVIGWVVAIATMAWTLRSLLRQDVQTLVSGRDIDQQSFQRMGKESTRGSRMLWISIGLSLAAVGCAAGGMMAGGQAAAGGFVGGGMLLLVAALLIIYSRLSQPKRIDADKSVSFSKQTITGLATRNASRNPLRSTLTIGLMSTAAFLIIAMAALQLSPTDEGTGGFQLLGQSATPFYRNLSDTQVQTELMGPDAGLLKSAVVATMKVRPGQDASCNNLYQASQPTILGINRRFGSLFTDPNNLTGFAWAGHDEVEDGKTPWSLLEAAATGTADDPIPVILDQNTGMWALKMGAVGAVREFTYDGAELNFRVVGMLSNSVLQGKLMIGETNFQNHFPNISGTQFFMFSCSESEQARLASALEVRLGDIGMDISESSRVLAGMLAVQNTYLKTFQSLGALGLLLGTIGLAIAQLRSVLERRKELAVMRAIGFSRSRLARIVMTETAALLMLGIGCGAICAVAAVLPYAWLAGMPMPVLQPLLVVLGIIAFGMLAGAVAVRQVLRIPLADALRPE